MRVDMRSGVRLVRVRPRSAKSASGALHLPTHLSPARVATATGLLTILLTLVPVSYYEDSLQERNRMYLNWSLYALVGSCVVAFCLGTRLVRRPSVDLVVRRYAANSRAPMLLACFSAVLSVLALAEFAGGGGSLAAALGSGEGEALRAAALAEASGGVTLMRALPIGVPFLLWAVFRSFEVAYGRTVILACLAVYSCVLLLVLQRNLLIPLLLSVAVIASAHKFHQNGVRLFKAIKAAGVMVVAILGVFLLVARFRGVGERGLTTSVVGYLPGSVNRLAAAVEGQLDGAYGEGPVFSLRLLWYPPFVRRFLPMEGITSSFGVDVPSDPTQLWLSEFTQVANAGLNPLYIWPTSFGYAFYDFGWGAFLYFLMLGIVAGILWRSFIARTPAGILGYAYVCSSVALWVTDNFVAYPQVWLFAVAVVVIHIVDRRVDEGERAVRTRGGVPGPVGAMQVDGNLG